MGTCSAGCVSITFVSQPRNHPSKLSLGDAGGWEPADALLFGHTAPRCASRGRQREPARQEGGEDPSLCPVPPQPHRPLMLIPFPAFPLAPEPASSPLKETCTCQQRLSSGASVLAPPASLSFRQKEEPPRLHPQPWGWRPLPVPRTTFLFTSPVLQYLPY